MKKQFVVVAFVFLLIVTVVVNKINTERNVQRLSETFSEMYDDRLVAESYIYQLSDLFYNKKLAVAQTETSYPQAGLKKELRKQTADIRLLAEKYALTRLTEKEKTTFQNLAENIGQLQAAEKGLNGGDWNVAEIREICDQSLNHLKQLSSIQIKEGKVLKESSGKIVSSSEITGQLEWALYFVLLLVFLSISQKQKIFKGIKSDYQLN